ncbi:SDR family oxidoreductase [Nocardia sp. CNY236]|uniref:SDR family NAD(P)-dependent oxidoreductase n=1 Tax=Nocardia sp. CNY236 TaxID=1169152 RepID=UPI00041E1800|nr:SDR family NAD(P)-dependent oxidoreductase [Nocardia sp. CNY236]
MNNKDSYFENKVCVITGAGGGIGRELATNLAGRGAKLALSDIEPEELAETARQCERRGAEVTVDRLNVVERADVQRYADEVKARYGTAHQIYNIAGVAHHGEVIRSEFKHFERTMDVDFWGVLNGTKAFLPLCIESGAGHIVNMSSIFGLSPCPNLSAYVAAKFAVRGFTESLRVEMLVARYPVKVTVVHPGGVQTPIASRSTTYVEGADREKLIAGFDRLMTPTTPEAAAQKIIEGVRKGRPRVVVGWDARAVDVLTRVAPLTVQRAASIVARYVLP